MVNPLNSSNLTLDSETYYRLKNLKTTHGWTFNQAIDKLCEMEFQNNYIEQVVEYSLITHDTSRLFRVTFKKENIIIEYYNNKRGYNKKIDNWELNKKVAKSFFEFINSEYARCMLENLPVSIEFKDFIIQRI